MAKMSILPNFNGKNALTALVDTVLSGESDDTIGGMPIDPSPSPSSIWTTKTGSKIAVMDMEDSHLHNSIEMVKRQMKNAQQLHEHKMDQYQARIHKLELERLRRFNAKKARDRIAKDAAAKQRAEKKIINRMQPTGRRFREI